MVGCQPPPASLRTQHEIRPAQTDRCRPLRRCSRNEKTARGFSRAGPWCRPACCIAPGERGPVLPRSMPPSTPSESCRRDLPSHRRTCAHAAGRGPDSLMPFPVKTRRYSILIHLLVATLLFSAAAPCGLIESAGESSCTEIPEAVAHAPASGPVTAEAAVASEAPAACAAAERSHLDCCAGCQTCCASYVEARALKPLALTGATQSTGFFPDQALPGTSLSIWRPPRL